MERHKRRQYFIDKEFQGRYIFSAFISVAIGSILFALLFGFFSSNTLSIVYEDYHLRLGTTPGLLLNRILSAQWFFVILGGMGIAVTALFLSHRVAGPFFRFEKTLEKMTAGDLSERIRLRKNDEGKVLAEKINGFNDMLSQNFQEMQRISENIRQCCDTLESGIDDKARMDLREAGLLKIRQLNQEGLERLGEFKIKQV
jgi:methyl-accepting chemotaxis protein